MTCPASLILWPEYTDISVVCGTSAIELAIQICPAIYTGYNESLLLLNLVNDNNTCKGTLDVLAVPPVLKFSFPIRDGNACGSNFQVGLEPVLPDWARFPAQSGNP